jgi:hypothetical protein
VIPFPTHFQGDVRKEGLEITKYSLLAYETIRSASKRRLQELYCMRICCRGKVFTDPLLSKNMRTHKYTDFELGPVTMIYIHTKFCRLLSGFRKFIAGMHRHKGSLVNA